MLFNSEYFKVISNANDVNKKEYLNLERISIIAKIDMITSFLRFFISETPSYCVLLLLKESFF